MMSTLGKKQTFAVHQPMSALPSKADMCGATSDVRFGPKADIRYQLFDRHVGLGEQHRWHGDAERLCGFEINDEFELSWLHDGQVGRLRTLKYFCDVNAGLVISIVLSAAIAHQATGL